MLEVVNDDQKDLVDKATTKEASQGVSSSPNRATTRTTPKKASKTVALKQPVKYQNDDAKSQVVVGLLMYLADVCGTGQIVE